MVVSGEVRGARSHITMCRACILIKASIIERRPIAHGNLHSHARKDKLGEAKLRDETFIQVMCQCMSKCHI